MRLLRALMLTAVCVALTAAALKAQEEEDPVIPGEIVVTARAPGSTLGVAPGVLVIDVQTMRRDGDVTVADLLRSVAGVDLQRRGSAFEPSSVRIRGSDAEQVLVLRDGIPLSDSRTSAVDMSRVSLTGVERIEIVLGPATAMYGVGGAAGAINLVSADAAAAPPGLSGSGRATWGSYNEYHLEVTNSLSFGEGATTLEVVAAGVLAGNTYRYQRAGEPLDRENAGGADGSLRVALDHRLAGPRRPRIVLDGSVSSFVRGVPGTVEFPAASAELQEQRGAFRAALTHNESSSLWSVGADAGVTLSARSFRDPDYPLGPQETSSQLTALRGRVVATGPVGPAVVRLPLAVTAEILGDSALGDRQRVAPALAPSIRIEEPLPFGGRGDLSAQGRAEVVDGTSLFSGRGSAGWSAEAYPVRLSLAGGAGYRMPDFADLFTERSAFAVGNPDLTPEFSRSVEVELLVGSALAPGATALGLRTAAHLTAYSDLIQWLPDPNGYWRPRNTGNALVRGVEVDMEGETPLGLSPWTLSGALGGDVLQALDTNPGVTFEKQLPYRAALAVRARGALEHLLGHRIALEVAGRGARPVTRQNTIWLDPYLRLDLHGTAALIQDRLYLGAAVRNILDEQYVETRFFPNPGREFRISLEARW